jgi:hypothetical protein
MAFLAAAAPIIGTVGAGISAVGAVSQGESQAAEAKYQAQVAQNNAITAGQNANYALQAGNQEVTNTGLQEKARAGAIRTGIAANNLDVNSGSAAKVQASQAELGEQAELTQANNAALTAYGYRTQATGFQAQSQLEKAEAPKDIEAGILSAGGSLLSGASNIGFKFGSLTNPVGVGTAGAALSAA